MSYSLNSLRGGFIGDYIWDSCGVIKGDTRSLDCSSYRAYIGRLFPYSPLGTRKQNSIISGVRGPSSGPKP